ncbi:response regulator transcription factor [Amycolatopsis sp. H20-H5]|uniref:response regulator transcription factor n=1 Tax=Amycolatopsis sp. H20-H5 TaxID=3046309 RepID=UPI002DB98E00|nr:response regulator transcription factor [Amycolatopsis sp. H20-H5]MEC3974840.1 response regulator transcription factor [Amycolatopsis sp. H20-H5]
MAGPDSAVFREQAVTGPTVVLADDHGVARERVRALLARTGVTVVAETGIGQEAVREVLRCRPDVLLIDPRSGERDGFEAIAESGRSAPGTAGLVLTDAEDRGSVRAAFRAGARGYLLKPVKPDQLGQAIISVARGSAVFDASVTRYVTALFAGPPERLSRLTARQREVLALVAEGLPNGAIARRLRLTPKTVRNHVSAVLAGLGVPDRAQAIVLARDAGFATGSCAEPGP